MKTVITGASRGIGLALTEVALAEGQTVFAVTRSANALKSLHEKFPSTLIPVIADVSTVEGRAILLKVVSAKGELDTLINNAGLMRRAETQADMADSFHLNATVPFLLTTELLPLLKKSSEPRVVQISTMMGSIADNSSGGYYSYRASKAALNMITKSLAIDNPAVRFGLLHPGWVKTEMGGKEAPVEPSDSALGLWRIIHALKATADLKLQDYRGRELPW